jgi:hypothetical protein
MWCKKVGVHPKSWTTQVFPKIHPAPIPHPFQGIPGGGLCNTIIIHSKDINQLFITLARELLFLEV